MNAARLDSTRLYVGLFLLCCALASLTFTGCAKDEKVKHVFVGDEPVTGTVQVATNSPIDVCSVDADVKGKNTNFEKRDCGQMVLQPPQVYRRQQDEAKELDRYRTRFGWFLDPVTKKSVGPDPEEPEAKDSVLHAVPDDGVRAQTVRL